MLILPQRKLIRKAPVSSLAFQASNTSTSSSITGPATIQAGDLLILSDFAAGFELTAAVPSGFNIETNIAQFILRHILSWKIADGSEAGASLVGMDTTAHAKILFVFRPDVPITEVTVASGGDEGTSGDPASQIVTGSEASSPVVIIGAYNLGNNSSTASINSRAFSPAKTAEINVHPISTMDSWLAYRIYNSSPSETTIDMGDSGDYNFLVSRYFQVA